MSQRTVPFVALLALGELVHLRDSMADLPAFPEPVPAVLPVSKAYRMIVARKPDAAFSFTEQV